MPAVTDWQDHAACLYEDPDLFFPIGTTGQTEVAQQVCAACPVQDECLTLALTAGMDHGIWGGRTEDDRRAIRSSHRPRRSQIIHPPRITPVHLTRPGIKSDVLHTP